jgi:hypothetical protein
MKRRTIFSLMPFVRSKDIDLASELSLTCIASIEVSAIIQMAYFGLAIRRRQSLWEARSDSMISRHSYSDWRLASTDIITYHGAYGAVQQRREHSANQKYLHLTQERPRTFQLANNYRSHGGVVHCAHSVIELIMQFWPYTIDVLAREQGVVDGLKPVFFSGWDKDTVRYVSLPSVLGTSPNLLFRRNNSYLGNRES